jgi:hypothetical protein
VGTRALILARNVFFNLAVSLIFSQNLADIRNVKGNWEIRYNVVPCQKRVPYPKIRLTEGYNYKKSVLQSRIITIARAEAASNFDFRISKPKERSQSRSRSRIILPSQP